MREKATFAAGCFWGVEAEFQKVKGVLATRVGYTGGTLVNPTYQDVCNHNTGHAEAIEIEFDPAEITYEKLLGIFWECHNPTTLNRQGPDIGTQYRSAIFFHSPTQQTAAEKSKNALAQSGKYQKTIVTEIVAAGPFYPAEEYHQRYFEKHSMTHCGINSDH